MSDYSFLPHFITEDIYVIKKEGSLLQARETKAVEEAQPTAPVAEAAPVPSPVVIAPKVEAPEPVIPVEKPATPPIQAEKPATPAIAPEPPVMKEPEPVYLKPLPTEGNNLKHCLLLVESNEAVLEAELKALLEKIMGAVKRSLDDVLLVNVKNASIEQIEALLSEQNHRHLIAFGTRKIEALNASGLYRLELVNRKGYLRADALAAIAQSVDMKKALWGALKGMF